MDTDEHGLKGKGLSSSLIESAKAFDQRKFAEFSDLSLFFHLCLSVFICGPTKPGFQTDD